MQSTGQFMSSHTPATSFGEIGSSNGQVPTRNWSPGAHAKYGKGAAARIFLTRHRRRGRYLINEDQVIRLLEQYTFEAVDTDAMALRDQIELFASARYVVGIHGAGLANLGLRQGPVALLEIFPANYIHPHYAWLAQALGFGYSAVVGSSLVNGSFYLDLPSLETTLISMLSDSEK
jgi:hypothetical protein